MAQKYVMVRIPRKVFDKYKNIQSQMCHDLSSIKGKPISLPMTRVFDIVVNHNENYIQVDLKKLLRGFRK